MIFDRCGMGIPVACRMFSRCPPIRFRLAMVMIVSALSIMYGNDSKVFSEPRVLADLLYGRMCSAGENVSQRLDETFRALTLSRRLYRENVELRSRIALMEVERLALEEDRRENDDLRELMRMPVKDRDEKMVVKVIGSISDPILRQVVVNRGKNHGLYVGQVVVSGDGVVGRIISASHSTSRVSLISDPSSSLSVRVLRSRIHTLARGDGSINRIILDHLPEYCSDLRIGDRLVTSGRDGVYPEGYPVAVIESIEVDNVGDLMAKARSSTDLRKLNYLAVIRKKDHVEVSGY